MLLQSIGEIRSTYRKRSDCPKQGNEEGLPGEIAVRREYLPAMKGLQAGQEVWVMTWLHAGDREKLQCHPRGDPNLPLAGVFMTRSPDRPNPIGLHRVRVLHRSENTLTVHPLEVLDKTPVLDIKPVLSGLNQTHWGRMISSREGELFKEIGLAGWQKGLWNGLNGNLSCRYEERVIMTCSGSAKGRLEPGDLVCLDLWTGSVLEPKTVSTESPMHLALYRRQPKARAIVHTHPVHLLALSLRGTDNLLGLPLYEAGVCKGLLTEVPPIEPGTEELAGAVAAAALEYKAIFLNRHGLVCWADSLKRALSLSEEIESLAEIQLKAEGGGNK